jgi:EAL domain-containing protein (putative c-di-GMP-specific phosphodiesterase class I)/ActR/RegA family two-component response regulator
MRDGQPKILAVDDEPFMLELLVHMLADTGFHSVRTCSCAQQALAIIDTPEAPDLVLLDLMMPGMDGVEFVRELGERRYGGSLILLSGEDEQTLASVESLVQVHGIKVLGHLRKPAARADLMDLIGRWTPPASPGTAGHSARSYAPDELRAAIANGEILNYYQPAVAIATGQVVGVECLVRWKHPSSGIVPPDHFVPLAETSGLIDELTRVVLATALSDAKAWQDAGLALKLAVNISMESLAALDFPDSLAKTVAAAGIRASNVVVEVTESRYMANPAAALDVLTRLRMKRFRLSIDDFGTGYSSLQKLTVVPFDELKVDRDFVHGASHDARRRAIVEASLQLARQLGLRSVAEGVEDAEDWNFLLSRGCDLAQGYYIARPMPAGEVVGWVAEWSAAPKAGRVDAARSG